MTTSVADIILGLTGFAIIVTVFSDVFQSIIVPHYRPSAGRFSAFLVSRLMWKPFCAIIQALPCKGSHSTYLTLFAPAAMMTLLISWLGLMITGFSVLLWAERAQIRPPLKDLQEAIYFAATSVLTIGYGDVVAESVLSRITIVAATSSGIVLLAITVSFLFAMQSHFHLREINSQVISSRFDNTTSGAVVYKHLMNTGSMLSNLELCERWIVEVYQSHSAYPLLLYFRSRGSCPPWLINLATVLDAVSIGLTMNVTQNRMLFNSIYNNGCRAVEVFVSYLDLKVEEDSVIDYVSTTQTFEPIFRSFGSADPVSAAMDFAMRRRAYYGNMQALAQFFMLDLPPLTFTGEEDISQSPTARGGTQEFVRVRR
ncbi:two pore domain potassium channel family protein [bacterium]|nr:two pore domain potassium channel family protein [bacterium]QQR58165.1 MAG: two pore domain potassium channel family protein [Candidatus Melainabacteria bacterium]